MPSISIWRKGYTENTFDIGIYTDLTGSDSPTSSSSRSYSFDYIDITWSGASSGSTTVYDEAPDLVTIEVDPPTSASGVSIQATMHYIVYKGVKDGEDWTWDSGSSGSVSSGTLKYYPKPNSFSFIITDTKWYINEGINSIIPNITQYTTVATMKKRFLTQSTSGGSCPSLFNSKNLLSAQQINKVYEYLGESSSYSSGDKVSKSIFTGLLNLVNGE